MKRIVCVWFPDWPITLWRRARGRPPRPDEPPFALAIRDGHGVVLWAVNAAARAAGLARGQSQADARAAVPGLVTAEAAPRQEADSLRRLALWAERFSPVVALDDQGPGQEGLTIDMTGGAHLFGGEAALLDEIERRLAATGLPCRTAIADTAGAAWALARFAGPDRRIAPAGTSRDALRDLAVEALRLAPQAVTLLKRLRLRRIGDLYGLPRAGLARRFRGGPGMSVVERLDQALGAVPEPLVPLRPPPRYRSWAVFAEPLIDMAGVEWRLPDLAQGLAGQLDRDGMGARRIALIAFRSDGATTRIEAGLSAPTAQPGHLIRLMHDTGLGKLDLAFGADALMLAALVVEPVRQRQAELDPGRRAGEPEAFEQEALAALVDRLRARLGDGSVRRPQAFASWLPERGERLVPATLAPAQEPATPDEVPPACGPRPVLMFEPPEAVEALAELPDSAPARFVWRRVTRRVVRAEGPERIGPEWWRQDGRRGARTRDYYSVEDEMGRRYWLYREGLYDRAETADGEAPTSPLPRPLPAWFLHGVFA
jgi:protein ImuB